VVEPIAVLAARVVLAVVFSAAAGAKLADQHEFRTAVRWFGVPEPLAPALAVLVPAAELAVAAGLVTQLNWLAALAALGLLLAFSAMIATGLVRGESFECRCFGLLGAGRLGWSSVFRNLGLGVLAAIIVAVDGGSDAATSLVVGFAASLAFAYGLVAELRQSRRLRRLGDPAPRQLLRTLGGETIELGAASAGETLLVFWDATCTACEQMTPHLERISPAGDDDARHVVVVSADTPERLLAARLPVPVVRDESRLLARALGVPGKPAAVLVDSRGRIASSVILGTAAIASSLSSRAQ
jgi:hypothetical protein